MYIYFISPTLTIHVISGWPVGKPACCLHVAGIIVSPVDYFCYYLCVCVSSEPCVITCVHQVALKYRMHGLISVHGFVCIFMVVKINYMTIPYRYFIVQR